MTQSRDNSEARGERDTSNHDRHPAGSHRYPPRNGQHRFAGAGRRRRTGGTGRSAQGTRRVFVFTQLDGRARLAVPDLFHADVASACRALNDAKCHSSMPAGTWCGLAPSLRPQLPWAATILPQRKQTRHPSARPEAHQALLALMPFAPARAFAFAVAYSHLVFLIKFMNPVLAVLSIPSFASQRQTTGRLSGNDSRPLFRRKVNN